MTEWYIKEFSKLTSVSVRTLHHYDDIGLLKPSIRLPNGYRLYSETDLLTLQQIIAFKFFGFELSNIQTLLKDEADALIQLRAQKRALQSNIAQLQNANKTLDALISDLEENGSIQWDNIIQLIEDYRMTKEIEKIWGFDKEKQKEYQKYLIDNNKATKAQIDQCNERTKNWKKEDWEKAKRAGDELNKVLIATIQKNIEPSASEVQDLVRSHYHMIECYYKPTKEGYIGLGQLYCEHPDFKKHYDSYHPKLAEFLAKAMKTFAENELNGS